MRTSDILELHVRRWVDTVQRSVELRPRDGEWNRESLSEYDLHYLRCVNVLTIGLNRLGVTFRGEFR